MTANVNVGNDIVLTCTARGAPETTFAWFRREPDVQLMTGSRVLITAGVQSGTAPDFVTVESTLMIFSSEESDAGIYSCVASNMVFSDDRSDSENFTLVINCEFSLSCVCVFEKFWGMKTRPRIVAGNLPNAA